jgi:hypothetical protein
MLLRASASNVPGRTERVARWLSAPLLLAFASPLPGCKACREDDEAEEAEERDQARDHYWRLQVSVIGEGAVRSNVPGVACGSDAAIGRQACGPVLLRFKELAPAMLEASPAAGWALDHWESHTREPDGAVVPRKGPMPDGTRYVNGFGYADTGELETVIAVFVRVHADGGEGGSSQAR